MKPRQIRVFDGLRITTEHMNHLQGSFHSSLQDIRGILGLGKVHQGFEVLAKDNAIIVMPGMAFDSQKNRIVLDEPKRLEVKFELDNDVIYICLRYEQVEEGQVEGQSTIIWDSCSILMRPTPPEPQENLIPIAKVVKPEGKEGAFEIVSLMSLESDNIDSRQPKLHISQGIARMASEAEGSDFSILVSEAVKRNFDEKNANDLGITLAEKDIPLSFQLSSLTCQSILSCALNVITEGNEGKANMESPKPTSSGFQATAHGEVAIADKEVLQFGFSSIHTYVDSELSGTSRYISELTESGIAHLPIGSLIRISNQEIPENWGALSNMELLVKVQIINRNGFKLICKLLMKGGISKENVSKIKTLKAIAKWDVCVGWKALQVNLD